MCFQGPPRSWGLAPQVSPPSLLPGPQFPGQGRVPPTPSGLANTFPGQRSTARGEGSFRSVSAPQRGAMLGSPSRGHLAPPMGVPCWGHPAEGTWHLVNSISFTTIINSINRFKCVESIARDIICIPNNGTMRWIIFSGNSFKI